MNPAQIHLALNHAPLFLSILGAGILIIGMIRKIESVKTIALLMLVLAALATIPVYLTGEGTEELVEELPGVNEGLIGRHEEMAKISLIIIAFTGIISLLALLVRKKQGLSKLFVIASLVLAIVSFGSMAQTAHLGGMVRHTEIRDGANQGGEESGGGKQGGTDDDD